MDPPMRLGLAIAGSAMVREGPALHRIPMELEDLLEAAAAADDTGYEAIYVPDHRVWDPFALLAAFAERAPRCLLGTGVVTVTDRTAAVSAAAASTLHEASGGRALLGLGAGPERRLARVAAYLEEVRRVGRNGVPIHLAALGPRMTELAGRVADGVLLNWCPPERVAAARREVARGAEAAGRDPAAVTVAVYVRACLAHDAEQALGALRDATGMYASIPGYRRQLAAFGLEAEAAAAAAAAGAGRPDEVPESLVKALCVWGTREEALDRFRAFHQAGADVVVVYPVTAQEPGSSLLGTVMTAAPDPAVER
jgi:alkanesulfonate monooxygenase SsuD/methylene tetrahydromethanopterin reductase-like flavin-dependent oxidoreductase (luciferase family)